ncbi:alpha/beta fold hydrolase [Pseudonocardia sp. TRM90224]|uniref:alpha/beta fold hydrolase n=1 Tax=Pseudonocardia sp. TRM90224 TaxID=2812678 RepID=UPI001E39443F|nr:alpha/beta fold hydrolase [Pseudonocardia sp. TRM90224]
MQTIPGDGVVIDESRNTLRISRSYTAEVDRAWWAWTDAAAITKWWGPAGWVASVHEMDVRPGGRWRFELAPEDGSAEPVRGTATYGLVDPLARLTYDDAFADDAWEPDGTGTFPTSVSFTPVGAGCHVEVDISFPDTRALRRAVDLRMADGYAESLDRLDAVLRTPREVAMQTITSTDGTIIAYQKTGSGPAIIVVSNVAEDHTGLAGLTTALSEHFTVISFDRRGRGASGDPQPYDPAREIDDIAALIDVAGGSAALTSGSGGCAITLDAATALGNKVTGLYLYDPPFIVDNSRQPVPTHWVAQVENLVEAGRRSDAVEYVMTEVIGLPAEYIEPMKQDPSWDDTTRYAHTFAYEGKTLSGLQDGKPLPADRWSTEAPIAVAVGGDSEAHFHTGAAALAALLPNVTILTLPGQSHGAFWAAPAPVSQQIRQFLLS